MSSKKKLRRIRQEEERERSRRKPNPALIFTLAITVAIALLVGAVTLLGERTGPEDQPWPGAVWSPAHDHWH